MSGKPFFDTNILIYAAGNEDPRKAVAEGLVAAGGKISVQVLNEFVNVGRRKARWSWPEIDAALDYFYRLLDPPLSLSLDTHRAAIGLARLHQFSFYDALIVAAALEARCPLLLTEDMADGMRIGELTIRNPFRTH